MTEKGENVTLLQSHSAAKWKLISFAGQTEFLTNAGAKITSVTIAGINSSNM